MNVVGEGQWLGQLWWYGGVCVVVLRRECLKKRLVLRYGAIII